MKTLRLAAAGLLLFGASGCVPLQPNDERPELAAVKGEVLRRDVIDGYAATAHVTALPKSCSQELTLLRLANRQLVAAVQVEWNGEKFVQITNIGAQRSEIIYIPVKKLATLNGQPFDERKLKLDDVIKALQAMCRAAADGDVPLKLRDPEFLRRFKQKFAPAPKTSGNEGRVLAHPKTVRRRTPLPSVIS